jgi:hypothetical protein
VVQQSKVVNFSFKLLHANGKEVNFKKVENSLATQFGAASNPLLSLKHEYQSTQCRHMHISTGSASLTVQVNEAPVMKFSTAAIDPFPA